MERKVVCLRPISNSINEYYPNKFQIVLLASFDIDSLRFDEVGYVSSFSINGFRYVYSTLVIDENEKTPSGYFLESLILTKKKEKRLNIEKKTVSSKDIWNNRFRGLLFPDPEELVTLEYENRILTNDFKIWYKSLKKESVDENTRDSILIDGIEIIENSAEISINKKRFWVNQNGQDVESNYNAGLLFYQLHCNYLFSLFSSENLLTNEIQNTIADIAEYISYYDDSIIENFAGEFANGNLLYNYDTFFNVNLYRNFIKNPENKYRFPDIDNVEYSEYIKEKTKQHYETVRTATYFLIYDVYILKRIVDEASDEGQVKDFDYFIGVLSLIPTELLYEVSPELKIAVIAHIACKKMSNWFNKGFYEEIVIKICSSFAQTDYVNINDFLSRLLSTEIRITSSLFGYEFYNTKQTLYENLYNNMSQSWNITRSIYGLSNYVAGTNYQPIDTKGAFTQTIYLLWQFSKYCPYDIFTGELRPGVIGFKNIPNAFTRDETGDFVLDDNNQKVPISDFTYDENAPENQTLFKYTHEVGYYRKIDESIYTPYDGFEKEDYALECAPLMISYESQKSLGVYVNNMEIKFFDKKIKVEKSENVYRAINTGSEEDEEQNNDKYFTYGVYDIYQPIGLISPEKIIDSKVDVLTIDGELVQVGDGLNVNSFIPAFVLHHIDNGNDRDATETIIGYSVDLALTVSGVGNISKLRHLRYGTGVAEGVGLFSRQGLRILIGSLDFTAGILGFLNNLTECTPPAVEETDPNYPQQQQDYDFCMAVKGFVTALEIAALSANAVDGLASVALYAKAKSVVRSTGIQSTDPQVLRQAVEDRLNSISNNTDTVNANRTADRIAYMSFIPLSPTLIKSILKKISNKFNGGGIIRLHSDYSKSVRTDIIILCKEELNQIDKFIVDLVYICNRPEKYRPPSELILQAKFHVKEILRRGFSSGFSDLNQYKQFCDKFRTQFLANLDELPSNLRAFFDEADFIVQGSAARSWRIGDPEPIAGVTKPNFSVDDIDVGIRLEPYLYIQFKQELENALIIMRNREKNENKIDILDSLISSVKNNNKTKLLYNEVFEEIPIGTSNFVDKIRDATQGFTNFDRKDINFAIIKKHSDSDNLPNITFKF